MPADFDLTIGEPRAVEGAGLDDLEFDDELGDELGDAPMVDESIVRGVLAAIGAGAASVAPYAGAPLADPAVPNAWAFTTAELNGLTPPLTRIINRRPALRRAVANGDYLAVGIHLAGYTGRNIGDLQRARTARGDDLNRQGSGGVEPWGTAARAADGEPGGGDGDGVPAGAGGA